MYTVHTHSYIKWREVLYDVIARYEIENKYCSPIFIYVLGCRIPLPRYPGLDNFSAGQVKFTQNIFINIIWGWWKFWKIIFGLVNYTPEYVAYDITCKVYIHWVWYSSILNWELFYPWWPGWCEPIYHEAQEDSVVVPRHPAVWDFPTGLFLTADSCWQHQEYELLRR